MITQYAVAVYADHVWNLTTSVLFATSAEAEVQCRASLDAGVPATVCLVVPMTQR